MSVVQPVLTDSGKIPSLDGMRAALFGIVFLSHVTTAPGSFGVTGFFFLSGYLITTLMRREAERTGTVSLRQFYLRRVIRIFPPLYLALCIAGLLVALGALDGSSVSSAGVLAQCFHWTNYWKIEHGTTGVVPGTGVLWSLAVEEHFYLLYPLIYLALLRARIAPIAQSLLFSALCLAGLLWRAYLVNVENCTANRTYMGTDTRFDSLLYGCLLAVWGNPVYGTLQRPRLWKYFLLPASLAVLAFTFIHHRQGAAADAVADPFREIYRYTLQGIALIPVFVCAIRFPHWWPFSLLNTRVAALLGALSYSMYLLHLVVIEAVAPFISSHALAGAVSFVITFVLAYLIHHLVEMPLLKLRHRLNSRPKASLPPAQVA